MKAEETMDKIAKEKGYKDWKSYYDWVARDGQLPSVVAQLIESAMLEVMFEYANQHTSDAMPTEEIERDHAEEFLQAKDIWNHPLISDRLNKNVYEVADLMAEFANYLRSRIKGGKL